MASVALLLKVTKIIHVELGRSPSEEKTCHIGVRAGVGISRTHMQSRAVAMPAFRMQKQDP